MRDQRENAIAMAKLMSSMLDDGNREALTTMQNSRDQWATEAAEFIRAANGDPVLSELASVCGAEVLRDSEEVRTHGFKVVMERKTDALRFLGLAKTELAEKWRGFPELDKLLHLMEFGQADFVKEGFVRNGNRPFHQSPSYTENRTLCNHHLQKIAAKGRTLIVTLDVVKDILPLTHFSPMTLAPKTGNPNGRLCNNLSKGLKKSINANVDLVASDETYPLGKLPDIHDICELSREAKILSKGNPISGATVDVNAAYNRTIENASHCKLTTTQAHIELTLGVWI